MCRRWSVLLGVCACAWLALIVVAPVTGAGPAVSAMTYAIGSFICHQRPDRSFYLADAQLPVCARCFGLYAGAAVGSIIWLGRTSNSAVDITRFRRPLAAAAIPTLLTVALEWASLWAPSNATRAWLALPLGMCVAAAVMAAANGRLR